MAERHSSRTVVGYHADPVCRPRISFSRRVFLGGDLDLFSAHIRNGDREALVRYGRACVHILHRNMLSLNQPIITIGLVEGDALGVGSRRCCRSTS
ncbi:hypothetical protein QP150_01840 [Sphingomonas sp. 22L2VL55-3]